MWLVGKSVKLQQQRKAYTLAYWFHSGHSKLYLRLWNNICQIVSGWSISRCQTLTTSSHWFLMLTLLQLWWKKSQKESIFLVKIQTKLSLMTWRIKLDCLFSVSIFTSFKVCGWERRHLGGFPAVGKHFSLFCLDVSDTWAFTVKTLRIRNLQYLLSLSKPVKMIDNMKGSRLLKNMSILCKLRVRNFL